MKKIFGLTILMLLLAAAGFADIRVPDRSTPMPTVTPPPITEKNAEIRTEHAGLGIGSAQMIVGGLFLSLTIIFVGVRLARRKMPVSKAATGVLIAE